MDEIVSTLLEGLLHQKEQLELTIEELNQFEKVYGKDSKITQDRLDKLSVDLDKISQDIETLKAIKPETIDLSNYVTLDNLKEAKDGIDGKDGINGKDGVEGINGVDGRDGKDGINGTNGVDGKDGLNGINGKDGKNGLDGTNGISIDTITYKNNTLYITLTDGTKKEFKLPVQYVGGGSTDLTNYYTKPEIDETITDVYEAIDLNTQAISNLATAQAEFIVSGTIPIPITEALLNFTQSVPSTNESVLSINDTLNRCYFGINSSFNFRTDLNLYVNDAKPITVTIRGRNSLDDSIVYSRDILIDQAKNTSKQVNANTLLTIGKNGFPSAPLTIYFTLQASGNGIDLLGSNTIITSSAQYDFSAMYTKEQVDTIISGLVARIEALENA